jgi:hypothetical protein
MKQHKLISVLITFVLILSFPFTTRAEETPYVQLLAGETNPTIGEEVTFSINMKNFNAPSNNLSSFEIKLNFDKSYWNTVSDKVDFGEYLQSMDSNQYVMPVNSVSADTIHLAFSVYKSENADYFSGDGTLFTFKLKPKKNGATDVIISKSLFIQISKPGLNVTHGKVNASFNIGGETPPPQPPVDPGTGENPSKEVIPVTQAEVKRTRTTIGNSKVKETIEFNGDNVNKTINQAIMNKSVAVNIMGESLEKEASYISFSVSAESIAQLVKYQLFLVITSEKAQLELSLELLKSLKENVNIDIYLQTDATHLLNTKKLISKHVKNGNLVGRTTEISANFSGKTKVTLPINFDDFPTDSLKLADYLGTLGVFVEHSDGELKFLKDKIEKDKDGRPISISILVDKFSTFSIVSDRFVKKEYVDDKEISTYAYKSVYKAQELDIMTGINDEPRFAPERLLTRAQFTKIIVTMLGEKPLENSNTTFKDLPNDHWVNGFVNKAVELGIVKGITADFFKPGAPITREQVALMIGRAYNLKPASSSTIVNYKDKNKISEEALPYVQALQEQGIMNGNNGMFNPKDSVTREMAAVITVRLTQK